MHLNGLEIVFKDQQRAISLHSLSCLNRSCHSKLVGLTPLCCCKFCYPWQWIMRNCAFNAFFCSPLFCCLNGHMSWQIAMSKWTVLQWHFITIWRSQLWQACAMFNWLTLMNLTRNPLYQQRNSSTWNFMNFQMDSFVKAFCFYLLAFTIMASVYV